MIIIQEGKLQFQFPSDWQVCKYDDQNNFYQNHIFQCQGTKAVDILAWSGNQLFMIEAKDFRDDRINNKERITKGELVIEVAQKIRDTIAGLYGAYRCFNEELQPFCHQLFSGKRQQVKVVLLLEEDHCHVHNRADLPDHFQWRVY